jgi:hypothetical protein
VDGKDIKVICVRGEGEYFGKSENVFLTGIADLPRARGFGGKDFSAMVDALCDLAGIEKPRLKAK